MNWLGSQPDVRLMSVAQATAALDALTEARFVANRRIGSMACAAALWYTFTICRCTGKGLRLPARPWEPALACG
jgi:hypothetical protein